MTQAGWIGTRQWAIAHPTSTHLARITIHATPRNRRIRTGHRVASPWKGWIMPQSSLPPGTALRIGCVLGRARAAPRPHFETLKKKNRPEEIPGAALFSYR